MMCLTIWPGFLVEAANPLTTALPAGSRLRASVSGWMLADQGAWERSPRGTRVWVALLSQALSPSASLLTAARCTLHAAFSAHDEGDIFRKVAPFFACSSRERWCAFISPGKGSRRRFHGDRLPSIALCSQGCGWSRRVPTQTLTYIPNQIISWGHAGILT